MGAYVQYYTHSNCRNPDPLANCPINTRYATDQEIAQGYWQGSDGTVYYFVNAPAQNPPLVVTGVTLTDIGTGQSGKNGIHIEVSATGAGNFRVLLDGLEIIRKTGVNAGSGSSWGFDIYVEPGTYQVCAEAI